MKKTINLLELKKMNIIELNDAILKNVLGGLGDDDSNVTGQTSVIVQNSTLVCRPPDGDND